MTNIRLNQQQYETFGNGGETYLVAMPKLIAAGMQPLGVADIMRKHLEHYHSRDSDQIHANVWNSNYFDTGDAIISNDGNVKIVCNASPLFSVTPKSKLRNGALIITPELYQSMDGVELTKAQMEKAGIYNLLPQDRVVAHPVWQALAGGDQSLLNDYTTMVFDALRVETAMGIYVSNKRGYFLRPWLFDGYGDGHNSIANGRRHLDYADAWLVGVLRSANGAEGGASTAHSGLESVVQK